MEPQKHHFSHDHPLTLIKVKIDDGEKIICKGCCQKICGSAYSCRNCSFSLHKLCAELPAEMKHPMHPEHPLTLLPRAPYPNYIFTCNACYKDKEAFTYHCSVCKFDVDIRCAVRAQRVEHRSHKHPLSPVLSPASFECHACGIKGEGVSYMCNTCRFWIHEDCASLPTIFEHSSHSHRLTLINSISDMHGKEYSIQYLGYGRCCGICEENLSRNVWVYYCEDCMYFAHVSYSTKTKKSKFDFKVEDVDEANLIHLPVADESVCLINQFAKQISLEDKKGEAEFIHFSHNHPLTLFNAHNSDDDLRSKRELHTNDKLCDVCVLPISTPFYGCSICNFFLHKWCAELPNEMQHLCHPHILKLITKSPDHQTIVCNGCVNICHGFTFKCFDCEDYYLDVKCASLPSSIVHEFHEHRLFLREDCIAEGCVACDRRMPIFTFGCSTCNFNLHCICALRPRSIRHRFDKHPFILTYGPIKDGPDEYYCEFCEEEINPKWWFYHCLDCDRSACPKCINKDPDPNPNPNSSKLGSTFRFMSHPHPLAVVQAMNKSPLCEVCHQVFYNYRAAFKCTKCDVMLHPLCACPNIYD